MELVFHGIHATAKDHADSIQSMGFDVTRSKLGKGGYGSYFWEYAVCKKHAQFLGRKWWEYSHKRGDYSALKCKDYCEIDVSICVLPENLLDCIGDISIIEAFYAANPNGVDDEFTYGAKWNNFIETLERQLERKIELLRMNLSVPRAGNMAFGNSHPALILRVPKEVRIHNISH